MVLVDDGTTRLVHLGGGFFALSETATAMLDAALRLPSEAAGRRVAQQFGVSVDLAEADLAELCTELSRRGLVQPAGAAEPPTLAVPPPVAARASRLAAAVARFAGMPVRMRAWTLLTLGWWSIRRWGWLHTVRAWQEAMAGAPAAATPASADTAAVIGMTVARVIAHHPVPMECKERALCCWALARGAGVSARIVVGVDLFPWAAHAWCEVDGQVVGDSTGHCRRFTPVEVYG